MNNHKVFISHSGVQKPLVEAILSYVGIDYAKVDSYCFESGGELTLF